MSNTVTKLGQSLLQATQGQLTFARLPETVFYLQKFPVPGISIPVAKQVTPGLDLPMAGNKMTFEPLVVTFLLDELMTGWYDIYNWMVGLGSPIDTSQYADLMSSAPPNTTGVRPPYSDSTLTVYSAKNNPTLQFYFADCFPTELTGVEFDYTQSADVIMTATATFRYSYYTFSRMSS